MNEARLTDSKTSSVGNLNCLMDAEWSEVQSVILKAQNCQHRFRGFPEDVQQAFKFQSDVLTCRLDALVVCMEIRSKTDIVVEDLASKVPVDKRKFLPVSLESLVSAIKARTQIQKSGTPPQ